MSNKMWGGRFGAEPDAIMEEINASIDVDRHLYAQDMALAKRLNQKSYRFSISWPRIQPSGTGAPNKAARCRAVIGGERAVAAGQDVEPEPARAGATATAAHAQPKSRGRCADETRRRFNHEVAR